MHKISLKNLGHSLLRAKDEQIIRLEELLITYLNNLSRGRAGS